MCLAQGHNAVKPVRLKSAASLSQVNYSTTEPLHTLCLIYIYIYIYIYRYARHTLCAGICEEHIEHKVCQEYLKHHTIVCQEYLKHMGMPGIPYVLEYVRNIFSTRYDRNTFSLICTQNIKHSIMPENLGLWVCQAYLMCWNI